jgi:hypothetical protein
MNRHGLDLGFMIRKLPTEPVQPQRNAVERVSQDHPQQ